MSDLESIFAAMATDYWKLLRSFERIAATAPPESANRLLAQARFAGSRLSGHLADAEMELAVFDGQEMTPAIPAVAINGDECSDYKRTIVASTVEPAIISGGKVIIQARVLAAEGKE